MEKWMRKFHTGNRGGGEANERTKLIGPDKGSGSSKEASGFWGIMVKDAQKAEEKERDKKVVRAEIQDKRGQIYRAKERANRLKLKSEYRDSSAAFLMEQIDEVKAWIDKHKNGLDLSVQDCESMTQRYHIAKNCLQDCRWLMKNPERINRGSRPTESLKGEQVDHAISFLTWMDKNLKSWSSRDNSQSQPVANPPLASDSPSRHDSELGLGRAIQEDPLTSDSSSQHGSELDLGRVIEDPLM